MVFLGGRRRKIFTRLAAERGARPGDRSLDVRCGRGHLTRVMAEAVGPDGAAKGIDPSSGTIAHARRITRLSALKPAGLESAPSYLEALSCLYCRIAHGF